MKPLKTILTHGFLLIAVLAKSQSEQVADTVKTYTGKFEQNEKTNSAANPEIIKNAYPLRLFPSSGINLNNGFNSNYTGYSKSFELPEYAYQLESYIARTSPNPLAAHTPLSYDFNHGGYLGLSNNSFLTAFQSRRTYMLIGTVENIGSAYTYATSRLQFTASVSVDKYRENVRSKYDANISAELDYLLSDKIMLKVFGMHSINRNKNQFSRGMYGMRPQTYYGSNINFAVTDNFYIKTGFYGTNYSIGGINNNDFGFNGDMGLWITDRVKIAAMGQYSLRNSYGGMSQGMGMYPQTYYGGYLEFKVTENFGVRGGALRQFDIRKGKWVTVPYFEFVSY
ncbi:MAG: hypothetical protein LBP85_01170 [Prevotellaceae bacterium]|jgi:hypothetical protein|nr:hypothetical protein [Prevotellaceae bacterium]